MMEQLPIHKKSVKIQNYKIKEDALVTKSWFAKKTYKYIICNTMWTRQ